MRGIVLDAEVSNPLKGMPQFLRRIHFANPSRLYFGVASDVSPWFEKAWSTCTAPKDDDRVALEQSMPEDLQRQVKDARLDRVA
jgi:hypothetical protein